MDWIDKLQKDRISGKYASKYGPWVPENFKIRNPISEAIDEGIDLINYIEMARTMGKVSWGLQVRLTLDIKRILNILKINE